jgi:hypothetical protein
VHRISLDAGAMACTEEEAVTRKELERLVEVISRSWGRGYGPGEG